MLVRAGAIRCGQDWGKVLPAPTLGLAGASNARNHFYSTKLCWHDRSPHGIVKADHRWQVEDITLTNWYCLTAATAATAHISYPRSSIISLGPDLHVILSGNTSCIISRSKSVQRRIGPSVSGWGMRCGLTVVKCTILEAKPSQISG